jgi:hypothetical protein
MKRSLLALLVLVAVPVGEAAAQLPRAMNAPVVSPYLNLARPGLPGINYYDLVRPQMQTDAFIQQQLALQQGITPTGTPYDPNAPLAPTGTTVRFMSQSAYFGTIRPTPVAPLPTSGLAGGQRGTTTLPH